MSKIKLKVIGTETEINQFTDHFTNDQIISMSGKYPNTESENQLHRFMTVDLNKIEKAKED